MRARSGCIANIAVMIAGAGVWASQTPWPDIAVAAMVAALGLTSVLRIIRQALGEIRAAFRTAWLPNSENA